ncbi:MAG: hypothetical protein J0H46_19300 [Bacteroidetes bacterium]|nr:hypothetical protein [Bacteroidota bacterium]
MILTIIVVALVYVAIENIRDEWMLFSKRQETTATILIVQKVLNDDMERANYIFRMERNKIGLCLGPDTCVYQLDSGIKRLCKEQVDSFPLNLESVNFSYVYMMHGDSVIRSISLDISLPYRVKNILFIKNYSAEELISINQ